MDVTLVYDGGSVVVPEAMGRPKEGQLQGTELDKLGELACRVCYDSLGRGRSSQDLHAHIHEAVNLSVYEHANFTVILDTNAMIPVLRSLINRKGVWIEILSGRNIEITINLRAVLEWERYTKGANVTDYSTPLGELLQYCAHKLAPAIIPTCSPFRCWEPSVEIKSADLLNEDQAWISLWMRGSRGFSHEQVRHRYAVSQRSTRYCDESQTPYVIHPMIRDFLDNPNVDPETKWIMNYAIAESRREDLRTYNIITEALETKTSRKEAQGAARGYLGNALQTQLIFSAPISGWKSMIAQRYHPAADAEIREIYGEVIDVLKKSRYGASFHGQD